MRNRESGVSLFELKVCLAIFAMILITLWTALNSQRRADRLADGYASDILGMRRALDAVEADLRAAQSVDLEDPRVVRVEGGSGVVAWRLRGGVLERAAPTGTAVVARNVAEFRVEQDGAGYRATVAPGRREGGPRELVTPRSVESPRGVGGAGISTLVFPRAAWRGP